MGNVQSTNTSADIKVLYLLSVSICIWPEHIYASWYGPEPFRRERIEGRKVEYETESFLNRFSFDPFPALHANVMQPIDGVFGTGGSTRSKELYVRQRVQMSLPTDTSTYVGYRFFRNEDYDGHFDEQLLGVGTRREQWQLVFWGDVESDKSETDLQLEWQWFGTDARYLRVILAAPDAIFNRKTGSEDEYRQSSYTLYFSALWSFDDSRLLYGFLNANSPACFFSSELNVEVDDSQLSAGLGHEWHGVRWVTGLEVEASYGERNSKSAVVDNPAEQDLQRQSFQVQLERRTIDSTLWYGVRYFDFREDDKRPFNSEKWLYQLRRETYLYAGKPWRIKEDLQFVPTVMAGYADIDERFPILPNKNEVFTGVIGKLLPAFIFSLRKDHSATISVVPTFYLHKPEFGGGNVQLTLPL